MTMFYPKHDIGLRTLPAMLAANAEADPDKLFLIDEQGRLTRCEVWKLTLGMSGAFADLGVRKGDTVVLVLDNRREFLASWFGLVTLGAIEIPMNPANVGDRLVHVFNHSGARTAIVQADYLDGLDEVADQLTELERVIVVGDGRSKRFQSIPYSTLRADPDDAAPPDVSFGDTVAIMYTSGSTGPAKGALLPHGQHYVNGWQAVQAVEIAGDDVVFVCLPLHHNMAQGYGVWPAIVAGAVLALSPGFDRRTFWDEVRACGATVFPFVGAFLVLLAKQAAGDDANPVRAAYGVPVPADVHEPFEQRFGLRLVHGYGSTEATIVAWGPLTGERSVGAAGQILDDYEVELHDADDRCVPPGEVGEICIRPKEPNSMFAGYHRDFDRTAKALRNLWFHSSDRGRFDERGNLWFVGRTEDVIRRLGEFISALEIEERLTAHPEVQLAVAYGVPSDLIDEEVMVAVVRQPGSQVSADELRDWCAERLPRFAVPRFVEFMSDLPMTATGKIEKYKLRQRDVTAAADDVRMRREGVR